jgi:carboxylesterase type B
MILPMEALTTPEMVLRLLACRISGKSMAVVCFGSTDGHPHSVFSLYTDAVTAGTRLFSKAHSAVAPTWSYRFWQVPDNSSIEMGAYHLAEVPYVSWEESNSRKPSDDVYPQFMGVLNRTARNPLGYRPDTVALSEMMQTFLINYVNTGDPNEGTGESYFTGMGTHQ